MKNKHLVGFLAALFLILAIPASIVLVSQPSGGNPLTTDSGVAVCQHMASSSTPAELDDEWRQERLTEFGLSKHEDLRRAGTEFTEAAFKMNEEMEDADLEKLNELNSNLVTKHAVLRNACKNHGVNVPTLSS